MTGRLSWLERRLNGAGAPLVIDGGMGTELQKSGAPMDGRVWSATSNLSHPHAVRGAHEAFIKAGAEVIITNTFSSARHMLEPAGYGDRVEEVNLDAVKLAHEARDNAGSGSLAIAGSICEWTTSDIQRWQTPAEVGESAREQAKLLARGGVDLIALEMCERLDFSVAVTEAALEAGLPLWIGLSAQSSEGRSSLSVFDFPELDFETLVEGLADYPVEIVNIMHTAIHDIEAALEIVRRHWDGPVGVYPESGMFTMPNWQFVDVIEPDALVTEARKWVDAGVRLVGGCCGLGPDHITALRQAFIDETC